MAPHQCIQLIIRKKKKKSNPPSQGTPKADMLAKVSNSQRANMEASIARIRALGVPLGIAVHPDFLHGTTGGSIDSHRLLELIRRRCGPVAPVRFVDALFSAIYEYNQDVSDLVMLSKLAVGITPWGKPSNAAEGVDLGMSEGEILRWLQGDEYRAEVIAYAKHPPGIQATPSFAVQGKYLIGGYQDPSVFVNLFERIEAQGGPSQ